MLFFCNHFMQRCSIDVAAEVIQSGGLHNEQVLLNGRHFGVSAASVQPSHSCNSALFWIVSGALLR